MRTSAAGNKPFLPTRTAYRGFTLIELLVVLVIIAIGMAGVSLALRDSGSNTLERDAQRLAALLEAARLQSRSTGVAVRWQPTAEGFAFTGLPVGSAPLPDHWLSGDTVVRGSPRLRLGPDPILDAQSVILGSLSQPGLVLRVGTDGLRPFHIQTDETGPN